MGKSDYSKVLRRGVAVMVILLLLLFGAFAPAAMAAWPDCSWGCTAADFNVIRVWLGDASGNEFDPGSCTPPNPVTAYIWTRIDVTANTDRYAGYVHYNLTINDVLGRF